MGYYGMLSSAGRPCQTRYSRIKERSAHRNSSHSKKPKRTPNLLTRFPHQHQDKRLSLAMANSQKSSAVGKRKPSISEAGGGGSDSSALAEQEHLSKTVTDGEEVIAHHFEALFHIPFSSTRVSRFNPQHVRMADIAIVDVEGEKHVVKENVALHEQQDLANYVQNLSNRLQRLPGPERILAVFEHTHSIRYSITQSDILFAMRTILPFAIRGYEIGFDLAEQGTLGMDFNRNNCDRLLGGLFMSLTLQRDFAMEIDEDATNEWKQDTGHGDPPFESFRFFIDDPPESICEDEGEDEGEDEEGEEDEGEGVSEPDHED